MTQDAGKNAFLKGFSRDAPKPAEWKEGAIRGGLYPLNLLNRFNTSYFARFRDTIYRNTRVREVTCKVAPVAPVTAVGAACSRIFSSVFLPRASTDTSRARRRRSHRRHLQFPLLKPVYEAEDRSIARFEFVQNVQDHMGGFREEQDRAMI